MYHSVPLLCRILVVSLLMGWHFDTQAAATITFSQVGNDVQATISGTLNLSALTFQGQYNSRGKVRGDTANVVLTATTLQPNDEYIILSGPNTIGTSTSNQFNSSGSGGPFGVNILNSRLIGFSSVLCGKSVHTVTGFWKGLAGRFESLPVVRKMMLVRLLSDLNPLALTMAA